VSGGTAPFFRLKLVEREDAAFDPICTSNSTSRTKYIGKDLSRARDEVSFYESLLKPGPNPSCEALGKLCEFMFEYLGILKATERQEGEEEGQEQRQEQESELDLLVLENLFDGKRKLRLLDLKIGSTTASGGWQGKSYLSAMRQQIFDKFTNSATEGYRLEGFDGCPDSLKTMVPLIEYIRKDDGKSKMSKKSRRLLYQHLKGAKIFQHLLDLQSLSSTANNPNISNDETYDDDEYLEIIMHEIVKKLTKLVIACHIVTIPQKWIGSSLAIGFDAGEIPKKTTSEEAIRKSAIVRIFDWGRSELNTKSNFKKMSPSEVKDREYFWKEYKHGIEVISWISTHLYKNRFCCENWDSVSFSVLDHDSVGSDDFMCEATVKLKKKGMTQCPLKTRRGHDAGSLTYSIEWKEFELNSRLKGAWKIKIGSGRNLPRKDFSFLCNGSQTSDPYVVVKAKPSSRYFKFEQMTTVVENNTNPVWNQIFSIPVANEDTQSLQEAFDDAGLASNSNSVISESKTEWANRAKAATLDYLGDWESL
jgi:hypothetical protein